MYRTKINKEIFLQRNDIDGKEFGGLFFKGGNKKEDMSWDVVDAIMARY